MRVIAVATVLVMLTQGVIAAGPFSTTSLDIRGGASVVAPGDALFLVSTLEQPFTWQATAASVLIERDITAWTFLQNPVGGPIGKSEEPRHETQRFTDARLESLGAEDAQGLLARPVDAAIETRAATGQGVTIRPVTDPRFEQDSATVTSPEGSPFVEIREQLSGEYLEVRADGATFELVGTFTLMLVGPDYALTAAEGQFAGSTGERKQSDTGGVVTRGESEKQFITLTDAVLRIDAPEAGILVSRAPSITFTGALLARDPSGDFPLPTLQPSVDGRTWTGRGVLDLAPDAGRILVAAPEPVETAGVTQVARSPPYLVWAATAVALLAVLAVALRVLRRREDGGNALELALLAMEDRRWTDALPYLERALRDAPSDAKILLDRALCLEEVGRLPEARDAYESALRAEPFNAETHYYYARTLARLRNSTASLAHLSRALALDARLGELARGESAFSGFRDHPQFARLLS